MKITITIFSCLVITFAHSQESNKLSSKQMLTDLGVLESAWVNIHPGLYRYNTPEDIKRYFDELRETCKVPLEHKKFYVLLSQLAQKIKCGHTFLNPLNMDSIAQAAILPKKVIPLFFEVIDNKIIITHNVSSSINLDRGDELLSINSINTKTIIDSLLTVSRSDGRNSLGKKINNINEYPDEANRYSLFDIYFPLFFPLKSDSLNICVKKYSENTIKLVSTELTTLEERVYKYENVFGKIPAGEKSWDFKLLNANTAYMKFGTFAFWNSNFNTKKYIDSVFSDVLKHKGITHLIIDIRGNEGGDNTGDYITSYITKKKLGCDDPDRVCYRYLSIPDSLLCYLDTWDNSFKKPKDPSKFFKNELDLFELKRDNTPCDYIIPKEKQFKGKVYLLVNAKNSSAGFEMARNFKTAKLGKLVGETTGGSQQGINGGEFLFLTLPNSKFEIDLPLIYSYHDNKPDSGIKPDYEVKSNQADIYTGIDTQLNYVLTLINKK